MKLCVANFEVMYYIALSVFMLVIIIIIITYSIFGCNTGWLQLLMWVVGDWLLTTRRYFIHNYIHEQGKCKIVNNYNITK